MTRFEFDHDPFDAAIHFGAPEWPGAELMFLRDEVSVPVCSPELLRRQAFARAADLAQAPLLHLATRPDAWERWFADAQVPVENLHGMLFDQFSVLSEAAKAGLGVALLPQFLIERELAEGELAPVLDLPVKSSGAYYLVWPKERAGYGPLQAFRAWIAQECRPRTEASS